MVQRDAFGTVPLFVGSQPGRPAIVNKFERVCELLEPQDLHVNNTTVAGILAGRDAFDVTLLEEVSIVYDRVRLQWSKNALTLEQPAPSSLLQVAQHRHGNPQLFRQYLEEAIDWHWNRYAPNGVMAAELSGGTDSA
jgi:hypothetical protein